MKVLSADAVMSVEVSPVHLMVESSDRDVLVEGTSVEYGWKE